MVAGPASIDAESIEPEPDRESIDPEPDLALLDRIRTGLAAAGDPERAAGQQRYMKSAMPFHGLTAPMVRDVLRPLLDADVPASRAQWQDTVLRLWDGATHREQRYAATALARHRAARGWRDAASLPMWAHLIRTGAWWDHVDEIAAHLVGEVLARHRTEATPVLREWMHDDDVWIRRAVILSQLRHRQDTDRDLKRPRFSAAPMRVAALGSGPRSGRSRAPLV